MIQKDGKTLIASMRTILFIAIVIVGAFALCSPPAKAQTFYGGGATLLGPSVENRGPVTPGIYGEAGLKLPLNLQARVFSELQAEPTIPTLFNNDGPGSKNFGGWEVRIRPALRFSFFQYGPVKPFVEAGFDYYRQTFNDSDTAASVNRYRSGLNPTLGIGAQIGGNQEVLFGRIFEDNSTLNRAQLRGFRAGYSYAYPLGEKFSLKLSGEGEYLKYYECPTRSYCENYFERDTVFRIRAGFILR